MVARKTEKRAAPRSPAVVHDFDPSIELLKTADSYWFLSIILIVLVVGIVGLFVYSNFVQSVPSNIRERQQVQVEKPSPHVTPETSPIESARRWRDDHLAATEFAAVPIRDADGDCFLVYTAQKGDSLSGVLAHYRPYVSSGSSDWGEICNSARAHHDRQYGHILWPGDEIWLLLPRAEVAAQEAPPEDVSRSTVGAGATPFQGA
jgi:hypothetical protein